MTLRIEVQNWFFGQILACYKDLAANFEVRTLKNLLESSKAQLIKVADGGYNDLLVVVPGCSDAIHVVERNGDVKLVNTLSRTEIQKSALFSNLSADDLSVVAGY